MSSASHGTTNGSSGHPRRRQPYSAWAVVREGLRGHKGWHPNWRHPEPKKRYDAVIIGGGGHGLATAYYLAKNHGITNVAVIEKGWLGGGNTGRNTTVIRSNYYYPQSAALYDFSLKLYERLSQDLDYNVMVSQRGSMFMAFSEGQLEVLARLANAMHLNGIDAELLSPEEVRELVPLVNSDPDRRLPIYGAVIQRRGGVARHDAVAWGYARAADALGVDIIQQCEVTDLIVEGGRLVAIDTAKGRIEAGIFGMAAAGHSSHLAAKAGFELPLHAYTLQAFVSEPIKPCLHTVILGAGGTYCSQSDKGELVIGGGLDRVPSYTQRGNFPMMHTVLSGLLEISPSFGQLKLLRQWGGIVDVAPDSSPIIGPSPVEGLYLNCGWGTGGFKAIPVGGWMLAHLLATGDHHPVSAPFDLARFAQGKLIDEAASSGIAH